MNESKAIAKHLDAAYRAMGLSPASSRPLSCCITELKEQLAEANARREETVTMCEQLRAELAEAKRKLTWYESHQTTAQCDLKKLMEEIDFLQKQLAAAKQEDIKLRGLLPEAIMERESLKAQLAAVTSELEVTSKHRDNAVDELRYGAIETVKQLDAVSEKVINDLKAQLAAVEGALKRIRDLPATTRYAECEVCFTATSIAVGALKGKG